MFTKSVAALFVVVLLNNQPLWATETAATTITVSDLHCAGCAKKVGTKLTEIKGVAKVEYDVEHKILVVTPKADTVLSPKALWQAVKKAGKTPEKLEGPSGTFTSKPNS